MLCTTCILAYSGANVHGLAGHCTEVGLMDLSLVSGWLMNLGGLRLAGFQSLNGTLRRMKTRFLTAARCFWPTLPLIPEYSSCWKLLCDPWSIAASRKWCQPCPQEAEDAAQQHKATKPQLQPRLLQQLGFVAGKIGVSFSRSTDVMKTVGLSKAERQSSWMHNKSWLWLDVSKTRIQLNSVPKMTAGWFSIRPPMFQGCCPIAWILINLAYKL